MLNLDSEYAMVAAWLGEVANIEVAIAGVTSAKNRLTVLMYFFIQFLFFLLRCSDWKFVMLTYCLTNEQEQNIGKQDGQLGKFSSRFCLMQKKSFI
jgi:hypothetical protein